MQSREITPARRFSAIATWAAMPLVLVFGVTSVRVQADDWSLTRPSTTAPSRRTAPRAVRAPGSDAASSSALAERYLRAALADPSQALIVERLLSLYKANGSGPDALLALLAQRRLAEPKNARLPLLVAALQRLRGDDAAARAAFSEAAELDHGADALQLWAAFEREHEDRARASELLTRALSRARGNGARVRLLQSLGELALELGDHATAAQRFRELARAAGGDLGSALAYARALSARGEHALAAQEYPRALAALAGDARVLPAVWSEQAKEELAAGQYDAALATLARARLAQGADAGIRAELGETLLAVHRARGSLAQLAAELSRTRDPESALLAARAYEELGQDESALEAYRHASHARPRDLELAQRILRLLSRRGRIEDVIAEYRTLRQRVPEHTDYVVELCLLLSDTGRRDEALQLLAEAGRSHPRDLRLHQRMADLYARWRQDTALARELELLARLDPDEPTHVVALGEAQLAQGKPEAARATFRRILERAGDAAEAHAQLGQVYLEHDLVPDALVEYERALHDRPEDAAFVRGHAEVLERALRPADAAHEWEHVLALAGDDAELRRDARKRLINLWAELGELPSRINELEHKLAAADGGKGDPDTARFLADAYERLAHNAMRGPDVQRVLLRAEDALQRVVRAVPGDVPSWLSIERLRVRRGDLEGAVAALDQLVQLDPRNARTYLARMADHALALYRDTDAIRYAERAVDLAPDDANAHERLGDLYRAQKDSERALASYERALALDPQRYALALRVAEMVLVRGDAERADALYLRALRESSDDDLVARAFRAALELRTTSGDLDALERELLGAALAHPDRPVYRRQLIDLYSGMVHRLELRSAGSGADAEAARAELRAIGQRAIKPLLEALGDHDTSQMRGAVEILGAVHSPAAALPLLVIASASDSSADVPLRQRALAAAGEVAGPEHLPRLLALAKAPEQRIRDVATWAIAQQSGAAARAALRELAASDAPSVRAQAVLGLGLRSDGAADLPLLRGLIAGDRALSVRVAAALALGMAGGHDAQVALLEATRAPDSDLARLSWIGLALQRETALAPRFAELVFAPDPRLRAIGGHALGVLGEQATTAHDPIRVALPAPLERAGTEQLEAAGLAVLGQHLQPSAAARFVAELQAAARAGLHAPRAYVQSTLTVLEAALIDGPSEPSVLDAATAQSILDGNAGDVIALAAQTDPDLRLRLLPVLGRVRSEAAATALAGLVADPHAQVRDAALDGLATATLPANGSQLEAPLAALALGDPAFGTRRRAVVVLGRLGGDGSARTLARVLSRDGYALVREAAATALAAVPASLAAPALLEALRSDDESRVRAAAARALGRLGGEPLRAARALPNLTPELRTILSAN